MVGLPYDCLMNPLGAVRSTFDKAMTSCSSDPSTFDGKDWGAVNVFQDFLQDNRGLSQVPFLSSASIQWLQPNTLVRFRGMIQDMLGNEFYVGAYKDGSVWRTNKFTDVPQYPMSSSAESRIWERRLLYCTPVPGRNSWTESSFEALTSQCTDLTSSQREKRPRADDEAIDRMVSEDEFQGSAAKKMKEDGQSAESSLLEDSRNDGVWSGMPLGANLDRNCLSCLVKIYDCIESDLQLNDIFEFVGILMFDSDPVPDKDDMNDLSDGFIEDTLTHILPSKVPRLHCLIHRKLDGSDLICDAPTSEILPSNESFIKGAREGLLRHLTATLGNDEIAAHFVLLHLLSMVHTRVENLPLGKLSLNLTSFSKEVVSVFKDRLCIWIETVLPFTQNIPLTVEYLNSASLAPTKDYNTNRLTTGVLQLPEGSHLLIDETQLKPGTLSSVGVENARLLKNLLEFQKVEYDFKYYKMDMTADVQFLILSEGKSNLLPADLIMPFRPCSTGSSETVAAETLDAWRWYLSTVRTLPHSIDDEMLKVLEDDLVAARQADRTIGVQDFNRWLTMARLESISYGEKSLLREHWEKIKELERLRKERLN